MKILFYNHTGQISGAEHVLLLILSRLDRTRFECLVVCPSSGGLRREAGRRDIEHKPINDVQARFTARPDLLVRYLVSLVRTMLNFRKLIGRERPALIHANSTRAGLVATAATVGTKMRVIWHLHDVLPRHPVSTLIRCFALLFRRRIELLAVSRAVGVAFRGRIPEGRLNITVIHNAIDTGRFVRDESAADKLRAKLNLSRFTTVFGIAGQLTPRKGQLELIYAFAEAVRSMPNSALLIIGDAIFNRDDDYRKELIYAAKLCGIEDKVIFLGPRKDIPTIFGALDVLVLNSHNEPFGLVLIEAMAVGTAVVATEVDGVPEIVEHDETGWLVAAGDQAALVDALLTLHRRPDLRNRLAESGREHARANFRASDYISAVEKYFGGLTSDESPTHSAPRIEQTRLSR